MYGYRLASRNLPCYHLTSGIGGITEQQGCHGWLLHVCSQRWHGEVAWAGLLLLLATLLLWHQGSDDEGCDGQAEEDCEHGHLLEELPLDECVPLDLEQVHHHILYQVQVLQLGTKHYQVQSWDWIQFSCVWVNGVKISVTICCQLLWMNVYNILISNSNTLNTGTLVTKWLCMSWQVFS